MPAFSRAFNLLLVLLIASFFVLGEQHQRNWLLYLAAAAAHGFLWDRETVRYAFAGKAGWTVPLLLAMPVLSLAWSGPVARESAGDLLLAAYCVLLVYLGVAHLTRHAPQTLERFLQTLLLGANLGALLSLGYWAANWDPQWPRLSGWLGLDNPVHASVLLLAATLPVCTGIAGGRLRVRWAWACAAPIAFVLLAGPRTALVAYLVVVALVLRPRFRIRTLLAGALVLGLAGGAALAGSETLGAIWLDRGLSHRPEIWRQTWSAFLSCNPVIGCGIAAPLAVEYLPDAVTGRAHSLYVAAVYHQGFLGIAVFLAALAWLLHCVRDRARVDVLSSTPASPSGPCGHAGRRLDALATKVDDGCGVAAPADTAENKTARAAAKPLRTVLPSGWAALPGQRGDWAIVLVYVLLASTTSGDHLLVRTTLFWCYFWLPVMVLAASTTALSEKGNSPATPA